MALDFNTELFTSEMPVVTPEGKANVTVDFFHPSWSSAISLANSGFYIIVYMIYYAVMVSFLIRIAGSNTKMKRNPKILFVLGAVFVAIQILGLVVRMVYDAMDLHSRLAAERGELTDWSYVVVMLVVSGISTFLVLFNMLFLYVILYFCQGIL